jgi:hypothetical protein
MRTVTYSEEAAPGAGEIMSWELDCYPQIITVTINQTLPDQSDHYNTPVTGNM